MTYEWKDKVVLITGAATGIGELIVRTIMEEGVKHVAVLDVDEAAGKALENDVNTKYSAGKVKFYKCDVTDEKLFLGIFDTVKSDQGYIDVVVNNAGIMNDSLSLYKKEIDINVTALITSTLKAIEIMGKHNGGRGGAVINISSAAALMDIPGMPIYQATKIAVLQFSNCIGDPVSKNGTVMENIVTGTRMLGRFSGRCVKSFLPAVGWRGGLIPLILRGDPCPAVGQMNEYYSRYGVRVLAVCFGATSTPLLSVTKYGHFDSQFVEQISGELKKIDYQSPQAAAQGVVDTFKNGESGSTWLVIHGLPAEDISGNVKRAYEVLSEKV